MLPPGYPLVPPHAPVTSFDPSSFLMGIPPASLNLLSLMQQQQPPPPSAAAPPATPYICNWMSSGEFCGKRFNSSEDLMTHLRTHTSSSTTVPAPTSISAVASASSASLASLQAAQTQAMAHLPMAGGTSSALAALQAQAAKMAMASTASAASMTHTPATTSPDLATAAAARYHQVMGLARPPMVPPPHLSAVPPFPPHLASLYPYSSLPVLYP